MDITRYTVLGKAHMLYLLPPSQWATNTCPSKIRGKTNCCPPRVSTATLPYVAGLVWELRLCLLPFRWPPPQLASPSFQQPIELHAHQTVSPSQPTSSKSSWQFSLPTYFSFHMANEHHSFHGAPRPLAGLELLSVLFLENATCGIWPQSQALASGQILALYC